MSASSPAPASTALKDIVSAIKRGRFNHKPIIIAIEGFGGSGKSTLANKLEQELHDAYVVTIDDFIIKNKVSDSEKSNYDRERLEKQVLLPIKNGRTAAYQRLEWTTNRLSEPVRIPMTVSYLIIEGVSSLHPRIAGYMDYKIWVKVPKDIARRRGTRRDQELGSDNESSWEHWTKTYQEYKESYHPDRTVDFIYDNSREVA